VIQQKSLLGPSFHDPRMHHVLESHPKQVAPLSRRDDMLSALTPPLLCASILQPDLIYIAFITGNNSLKALLVGLCAQIHVNLS